MRVYKVVVYAERAGTLPLFLLSPYMYFVVTTNTSPPQVCQQDSSQRTSDNFGDYILETINIRLGLCLPQCKKFLMKLSLVGSIKTFVFLETHVFIWSAFLTKLHWKLIEDPRSPCFIILPAGGRCDICSFRSQSTFAGCALRRHYSNLPVINRVSNPQNTYWT